MNKPSQMDWRVPVTIQASDDEEKKGPPTFSALAYSGAVVPRSTSNPRLPYDYVLDLAGVTQARNVTANLDHKADKRVGHATAIENDGTKLSIEGVMSAETPHRDEVAKSAANGMPWDVSIEGNLTKLEKVAAGKSVTVNGQTLQGPLYVVRKTELTGLAFVTRGADAGNSVSIAASAAGETQMNDFEKWMVSCGIDPNEASDDQKAKLQVAYDAQNADPPPSKKRKSFEEAAAEIHRNHARQERIQEMALSAMRDYPHRKDAIQEMTLAAIEGDTEPHMFELELLRGMRLGGQNGGIEAFTNTRPSIESDPVMIEAAICLSAGMPKIESQFSSEVLNSVDRAGMRNFSLQQLLLRVASANGYTCRPGDRIHSGNLKTVLEYCFPPVTARLSGFSNIDLPNILGNVANKELLAGYMEQDQTWREISSVKPVNNFHQVTSYRMLDDLEYEELGPAGEIRHGKTSEESYTRQAKTYAKMLGLTRTDIINDDLGAFDDLRTRLGRGAAKKFNNVFWAAFMDNASFFTAGRTNYIEGATSNLGSDGVGLGLGVTAYRKMTTPTGDGSKRVGASMTRPTLLLVPPELEHIADALFVSRNMITGADTTLVEANTHVNKYRPVVQNRLSDSGFTGNSTTAWYLFGEDLKPMVASFLNGNESPTVESTDADFDTLGILFRGYHDFGADKAEYLAGIKSKGAS